MTMILSFLCVILLVFNGVKGEEVKNEGEEVTFKCHENLGTVFWLRLGENGQGFEYTATYSNSKKAKVANGTKFQVSENTLQLKNFQQKTDSGTYGCFSINNNELKFSGVTKLRGKTIPTTSKPKVETTSVQTVAVTTKAVMTCGQNSKGVLIVSSAGKTGNIEGALGCELHIFIPLVAGCGVLLLLLLFTILYCNRIRTRRCPHHYKRHHRGRPAGHKTLPNPPDY